MFKNLAATVVAACCMALASQAALSQTNPQTAGTKAPLKIGFVYVAPLTEAGWVHQHDEGRKAIEAALGARVQTSYVADVAEGPDAERVIRDLAGIAAGRMTTRTWMW
jgi:basic membrane protein A and related proteins